MVKLLGINFYLLFYSIQCHFIDKYEGYTRYAGLFTPYAIIPGGGERYFLTSALALQQLGYHIEILVTSDNVCNSTAYLRNTSESLRIALDFKRLSLKIVKWVPENRISGFNNTYYDVFFLLGNSKLPFMRGLSPRLNIYMCQFPFDMYDKVTHKAVRIYAEYDIVLLNSVYTYNWYSKLIQPVYESLMKKHLHGPSVKILYPPVSPFTTLTQSAHFNSASYVDGSSFATRTIGIIMIGRFFLGRQSKGHDRGIEIFKQLLLLTRQPLHLYLVGNIHPEPANYEYVAKMKEDVRNENLPVTFLNNADPNDIAKALFKSTVYWHLTGVNQLTLKSGEKEDPASLEHFGISVVEAMAAGCIPIVLNKGGTVDIVINDKNGFLAETEQGFIDNTLKIIKLHPDRRAEMRHEAVEQSKCFHMDNFLNKFRVMVVRASQSRDFKKTIVTYLPVIRSLPKIDLRIHSEKTAIIIEPDINSQFEFCVRNILRFLDSSWAIQVYYSTYSELFVKYVLKNIPNIQFRPLHTKVTSASDYNYLMKSEKFWTSVQSTKVLIFQSDSILLRAGIDRFLMYDYIGAPWNLEDNELIAELNSHGILTNGVGNGGFSIRTVPAMLNAIRQFGHDTSKYFEQEDIFFAHYIEKIGYAIPDVKTAYEFAIEVPLLHIDSKYHISAGDHLAFHATWYYLRPKETRKLFRNIVNSMLVPTSELY